MIEVFLKILVCDIIWVLGFKVITEDGMALQSVGDWGKKMYDKGYKIMDGLINCPFCLPNIHCLLFIWPIAFLTGFVPFEWEWRYLIVHVLVACAGSFICGTIWTLFQFLEVKKKYFEHLEQTAYFDLKQKKQNYNKNKKV